MKIYSEIFLREDSRGDNTESKLTKFGKY